LQLAASYLDDASLQSDAAVSAARIALPAEGQERGLEGYEVAKVLKKAIDLIKNDELKQQAQKYLETLPKTASVKRAVPEGFTALFNGQDLTGWKGVLLPPNDNPIKRAALTPEQRAECQAKADESMKAHWSVEDGVLVFDGHGFSLSTAEDYENFEMYVGRSIRTATAGFICAARRRCKSGIRPTGPKAPADCITTRRIRPSRWSRPTIPSGCGIRFSSAWSGSA
jgi:hypothetical protein